MEMLVPDMECGEELSESIAQQLYLSRVSVGMLRGGAGGRNKSPPRQVVPQVLVHAVLGLPGPGGSGPSGPQKHPQAARRERQARPPSLHTLSDRRDNAPATGDRLQLSGRQGPPVCNECVEEAPAGRGSVLGPRRCMRVSGGTRLADARCVCADLKSKWELLIKTASQEAHILKSQDYILTLHASMPRH